MWYLENKIPEGNRNNALFVTVAKYGYDNTLLQKIREKAINVDGLPPGEVDRTIASALKRVTPVEQDPAKFASRIFVDTDSIAIVEKRGNSFSERYVSFDAFVEFLINRSISSEKDDCEYFYRINPTHGKSDADVEFPVNTLIECDEEELDRQFELLELLKPIAVAAYYSGRKSIHIICRVGLNSIAEYKARVHELHDFITKRGYKIDRACKNPSRLSRLPFTMRGESGIEVVYISEEVMDFDEFMLRHSLPPSIAKVGAPRAYGSYAVIQPVPVLIDGLMRCGQKAIISGSAKIGKSMSMLWLAAALSNGETWYNMKCKSSNVLYVNLEIDTYTMKQRCDDLFLGGVDCRCVDIWNLRGTYNSGKEVLDAIYAVNKRRNYEVVIIDPIYLILDGDESDSSVTKSFLNKIDRMIVNTKCAVILVHHFAKGLPGAKSMIDRASGSSNFARWADAFVTMTPLQTQIRNAFRLECISRSLLSPEPTDWCMRYPTFHRINGAQIKLIGEGLNA